LLLTSLRWPTIAFLLTIFFSPTSFQKICWRLGAGFKKTFARRKNPASEAVLKSRSPHRKKGCTKIVQTGKRIAAI
jgi:hypothetical protein